MVAIVFEFSRARFGAVLARHRATIEELLGALTTIPPWYEIIYTLTFFMNGPFIAFKWDSLPPLPHPICIYPLAMYHKYLCAS